MMACSRAPEPRTRIFTRPAYRGPSATRSRPQAGARRRRVPIAGRPGRDLPGVGSHWHSAARASLALGRARQPSARHRRAGVPWTACPAGSPPTRAAPRSPRCARQRRRPRSPRAPTSPRPCGTCCSCSPRRRPGRASKCACRRSAPCRCRGPAAHAGHAAERRRDRRGDLDRARDWASEAVGGCRRLRPHPRVRHPRRSHRAAAPAPLTAGASAARAVREWRHGRTGAHPRRTRCRGIRSPERRSEPTLIEDHVETVRLRRAPKFSVFLRRRRRPRRDRGDDPDLRVQRHRRHEPEHRDWSTRRARCSASCCSSASPSGVVVGGVVALILDRALAARTARRDRRPRDASASSD